MDNATLPPIAPVMDSKGRTTINATPRPAEKAETKFPRRGLQIPLLSVPICQLLKETNGIQRRRRGAIIKIAVAPTRAERTSLLPTKTGLGNPTGIKRGINHIPVPATTLPPKRRWQPKVQLPAQAANKPATLTHLSCSAPTIWASLKIRDTALPTSMKWRTVFVPSRG